MRSSIRLNRARVDVASDLLKTLFRYCASRRKLKFTHRGHRYHRESYPSSDSTMPYTPSSASSSAAASLPPASARSGRPPPLPPTFSATLPTILPACTRPVRSFVTPAISETLPLVAEPTTTTPEPSLVAELIDQRAQLRALQIVGAMGQNLYAADFFDFVAEVGGARRRRLHADLIEFARQALDFGVAAFEFWPAGLRRRSASLLVRLATTPSSS